MTETLLSQQKIVFIGAGSMAEALLRGLIAAELIAPKSVTMLNRNSRSRLEELRKGYDVRIPETDSPEERNDLVREADIVVFAMKPKDVGAAVNEFLGAMRPDQLIVSVVAGLSIGTIERMLGRKQPIVRTMPNTSSTIGLGAAGLACSETVSEQSKAMALSMLEAAGIVIPLEEDMLNIVTGVSGSGPAYVYYLMESMIQAGVDGGLAEPDARALVLQTVLGAAEMVRSTGEAPSALREKVTSPNGTTFAAIGVLEQYRFQEAIRKAIARAADRADEMGDEIAAAAIASMPGKP